MNKAKIYLSVVIPAYKEAINIKSGALEEVWKFLSKQKYSWEVLVVDDGSPDNTVKLAQSFSDRHKGFRVLKEIHRGKGGTVIAGMLAAKGEIVLFADMDQATPIDQVGKIFPKFSEGYDGVIGSRSGRKGASIVRKVMALGFAILRTIILGLPYKDTQCGFKAFNRSAAKKVFSKMKIFSENNQVKGAAVTAGFDLEMLYIARKLGLKIAEVDVYWEDRGERNEVNPIKDSWEGLRDLIKVRINSVKGVYK